MNKPRDGWLVRNVEDETFGTGDPNRVYASVLTLTRARRWPPGPTRCDDGDPGRLDLHLPLLRGAARLDRRARVRRRGQRRLPAAELRCGARQRRPAAALATWSTSPGAIAWSPFSNLWLYGETTDVPAARGGGRHGLPRVGLGARPAPSTCSARPRSPALVADQLRLGAERPGHRRDDDLPTRATSSPARGAASRPAQPGAIADLVVIERRRGPDAFSTIVAATERDVQLVVVGGQPLYGTTDPDDGRQGVADHDDQGRRRVPPAGPDPHADRHTPGAGPA